MSERENAVVDPKIEGLKVKKKPGRPRKLVEKANITKLDLTKKEEPKKEEDAVQVRETKEVPVGESPKDSQKMDKDIRVESSKDDIKEEEIKSPISQIEKTEKPVKEEIKKPIIVDVMAISHVPVPMPIQKSIRYFFSIVWYLLFIISQAETAIK